MICKIFYRKVTGDVEKMRISKKEEKKCKIVETEYGKKRLIGTGHYYIGQIS